MLRTVHRRLQCHPDSHPRCHPQLVSSTLLRNRSSFTPDCILHSNGRATSTSLGRKQKRKARHTESEVTHWLADDALIHRFTDSLAEHMRRITKRVTSTLWHPAVTGEASFFEEKLKAKNSELREKVAGPWRAGLFVRSLVAS